MENENRPNQGAAFPFKKNGLALEIFANHRQKNLAQPFPHAQSSNVPPSMAISVEFPATLNRRSFEKTLASQADLDTSQDQNIILDLKSVTYVELASLFCINSFILGKAGEGRQVLIDLPEKKAVRDFMITWRYPESLQAILNTEEFTTYLTPRSINLLTEQQTTYSERGNDISKLEWDPDWREGSRTKRNFFEITSFHRKRPENSESPDTSISFPFAESQRWERPLIRAILDKHLGKENMSAEIAKVVIYEAMSNAIRHPNATHIQTASLFQDSRFTTKSAEADNTFRICIWDNGDAIPATLVPIIKDGQPIRTNLMIPPYLTERIACRQKRFEDKEWQERIPVIDEAEDVNSNNGEEGKLLVYSTFPGVTKDASKSSATAVTMESISAPSSPWIGRGMGLYALRKVVVNQLQGALTIRCGTYMVKFLPSPAKIVKEQKVWITAEITSYEKSGLKPFIGNLLEITLPLKPN